VRSKLTNTRQNKLHQLTAKTKTPIKGQKQRIENKELATTKHQKNYKPVTATKTPKITPQARQTRTPKPHTSYLVAIPHDGRMKHHRSGDSDAMDKGG
jgi:hypothetical protein